MGAVDYYKILDIPKNSNDVEIKKAFRKQALKFHPDRNKDIYAKKHFQQINEAFEILSDKIKRHQYDQQTSPFCVDAAYAEALFSQFFSDHLSPPCEKPQPIKRALPVSLNDIYTGATKKLKITRNNNPSLLTLHLKPGVKHGTRFTYEQDIQLEIQEQPHPVYQRQGDDLHTTVKLTLLEALTGFKKSLPKLDGEILYICTHHRVIQSGQQQVLVGQGMPNETTGQKGNLIIHFHVDLPTSLSSEQCKQLQQILS